NYAKLDLDLSPGLNLFVGPNGSGKSNLLEAVSVLCTGSRHRGAEAKHLIRWEQSESAVKGHFEGEHTFTLEMRQKARRPRQFLLNGH
ncbi:DNA replication and repair protein RecF, partial [Citrobacter sp. AAK_AS5]